MQSILLMIQLFIYLITKASLRLEPKKKQSNKDGFLSLNFENNFRLKNSLLKLFPILLCLTIKITVKSLQVRLNFGAFSKKK